MSEKSEKIGTRRLYKGEIKSVGEIKLTGPTPVQPKERVFKAPGGFSLTLPATFILTRFQPSPYAGAKKMEFFDPRNQIKGAYDVPDSLELNLLSGTRAKQLNDNWEAMKTSRLSAISPRLACTIGTDPEIFVVKDLKSGGVVREEIVPAWTFLKGKDKPDKYGSAGVGSYRGDVYWDGFQAEFTTPGHLTCLMQMCTAVRMGLNRVFELKPAGSRLSISSVLPVEPKVLAKAEDQHVAFGCAPSYNLYGLRGEVSSGRMTPYRFAGGHIHFGLQDKSRVQDMVRALDAVLGVASVSLFASFDSKVRRQYYGQPGEYRTPAHGLEYRVLSNGWLAHPVILHMVFDLARSVAGLASNGFEISDLWEAKEEETIETILNSDVEKARGILTRNRRVFAQLLYAAGSQYSGKREEMAWNTWTQGMEYMVKNPKDVEGNWSLGNDAKYYGRSDVVFGNVLSPGV